MYAAFNRKKIIFYSVSVISALCLIAVIVGFCSSRSDGKTDGTNAICVSFLKEKKVKLAAESPQSIENTLLPQEFPETVLQYNELQKKQGFDLSDFAGKTVTKYTYTVKDKARDDVVAVVFVYSGKIIGGDLHSVGVDGCMTGFCGETV